MQREPNSFSLRSVASPHLTVSVTAMARISASLNCSHPGLWFSGDHDWNGGRASSKASVAGNVDDHRNIDVVRCNDGSGRGDQTGTPAGRYALTVTASANGSINSTNLTLIVE